MGNFPRKAQVFIDGNQPNDRSFAIRFNSTDPPYFETMAVPLIQGRGFTVMDNENAPLVALINRTMAARFWMNQDPVGKRFRTNDAAGPPIEVVGVTGDGKYGTVAEDPQPFFDVPLAQNFVSHRILQIRARAEPGSLANSVK